jgi:asparagine synthase (glutamine-hydrolysing)
MCGIAGILSPGLSPVTLPQLETMTHALAHRGPDGQACWINDKAMVGFGHRRLSIIDLTETGAQPMHYLSRYTIVHNGEIYNYKEIRHELQKMGYTFHSQSDTEVILAAYDRYKTGCLQHFDGMFAFAIWDEQEQELFAARDRFGEKPFFYYFDQQQFVFASEMKALWALGIEKRMNEKMYFNYFTLGYTQNPSNTGETFYSSINKLPARSFLLYNLPHNKLTRESYWDIDLTHSIQPASEQEATEQFTALFTTSVNRRLRSDVPVGTSLSGGLDSSSVLTCVHDITHQKMKTFSAVFPGFDKDESAHIQLATAINKAENYQVTPSAETLLNNLETISYHQEEPFQSASIIAQYSVFELAKQQQVTVLLDGQGADETLAGYNKYFHWYWQQLSVADKPQLQREIKATQQAGIPVDWGWQNKLAASFPVLTGHFLKSIRATRQRNQPDLTKSFITEYGISNYDLPVSNELNNVLYYNTLINGLEELLRYADRNSMAHGREVRLPFLNHELVQFIFSLPAGYKIRDGWTKWILRKSMENRLPAEITWRRNKVGFEPPQQQWMENKDVQEHIREAKRVLVQKGILKSSALDKKIQPHEAHAAENYDWKYLVAGTLLR